MFACMHVCSCACIYAMCVCRVCPLSRGRCYNCPCVWRDRVYDYACIHGLCVFIHLHICIMYMDVNVREGETRQYHGTCVCILSSKIDHTSLTTDTQTRRERLTCQAAVRNHFIPSLFYLRHRCYPRQCENDRAKRSLLPLHQIGACTSYHPRPPGRDLQLVRAEILLPPTKSNPHFCKC